MATTLPPMPAATPDPTTTPSLTTAAQPRLAPTYGRHLPLIGNLLEVREGTIDIYKRIYDACGDVGRMRVGPIDSVIVSSADLAYQVLVNRVEEFEKEPVLRNYLGPLLGNGIIMSYHQFHKQQRKLMQPAFTPRQVQSYAAVMGEFPERYQADWADGATVDVASEMMKLTLWVIGKVLFDFDTLEQAEDVAEDFTVAQHWFQDQFRTFLPLPLSWPTPRNQRYRKAMERFDKKIYAIIADRRANPADRNDLLTVLLRARDDDDGSFMTDRQLRDEMANLLLAGHETTANALAWAWYLLTQNPDVYARARAEVDGVLRGRPPVFADLPRLPYVLQVFKETLRLYPPLYAVVRRPTKEMELGGYRVGPETFLQIAIHTIQHRADYFPDPERFDPDRFLPEAEKALPRCAFLPFIDGPRICMGNQFALQEVHLAMAAIIQRVTFELAPGQDIRPDPLITLRPKYGMKMIVRRR